jgi:3-hydroxybutyryl-CoA dehydrogenase
LLTIAIIGAGPLGRWLAFRAARAGFRVLLEDVMPANLHHAQEYIRRQLSPGHLAEEMTGPLNPAHGEITSLSEGTDFEDVPAFDEDTGFLDGAAPGPVKPSPNATGDIPAAKNLPLSGIEDFSPIVDERQSVGVLSRERGLSGSSPAQSLPHELRSVTFVHTIEDAVREADLAIDCVPDELESKLEILWLLDRMSPPRTVLLTPTTRLSIGDLAACTYRAEKCVAIVAEARGLAESPAAEILLRGTSRTTPETTALVGNFWQQLGFTPRFEIESAGVV